MRKIMIVDDDRAFAVNVATIIGSEGYEVVVEDRTDEAVSAVERESPDLVVLDVMYPGDPAGGFKVARQIRRTEGTKDLPLILLTGMNQELPADFSEKDIDDKWMPVQGFFEKPPDFERMLALIRKLL